MYPKTFENLIESFKTLPGIGAKTAERLAFSVLELEKEQLELFSSSLLEVKEKLHKCEMIYALFVVMKDEVILK